MSDPWITYGPGCEIDPEVVENRLRYCADWDDSGPAIEIARKSITALQQREERIQKAINVLRTESRLGRATTGSIISMLNAVDILEGAEEGASFEYLRRQLGGSITSTEWPIEKDQEAK